jgi:hypothetical protein
MELSLERLKRLSELRAKYRVKPRPEPTYPIAREDIKEQLWYRRVGWTRRDDTWLPIEEMVVELQTRAIARLWVVSDWFGYVDEIYAHCPPLDQPPQEWLDNLPAIA